MNMNRRNFLFASATSAPLQSWDQVYIEDGKLVIWKPDFFPTAFFVETAD